MFTLKRGFTLIELLVVIAIISLLLAVLMPALQRAKEMARVVTCLSNFKSIGLGMFLYADANDGKLMTNDDPGHPYTAYRANGVGAWKYAMKLGLLHETGIIEVPEIFYCPSNKKENRLYKSYCDPTPWGTLPQNRNYTSNGGNGNQWVRTGCTYFPQSRKNKLPPVTISTGATVKLPEVTDVQTDLSPYKTMVTDIVWNWNGIAHRKGDEPRAINAVFGDGHAKTTLNSDKARMFDRKIWFDGDELLTMRPYAGQWGPQMVGFHTILSLFQP